MATTANGQLKTMLRQGSRAENDTKTKKNVRFVTESVSSGYSSSELDIHMNIPMSPNVKFGQMSSPAAANALIYRNNNSNNNNNGNNNVFQYPQNSGAHRQLTFVPNPAVPHHTETARAKQMFISPPPSVAPAPYLPTIVEQPPVVYAQQQQQQQHQQQQQRMHTPPAAGANGYGHPYSERWNRWNSLVLFHWPYLIQLDEQSRFDKICELSVIAASSTNCLCSQCRA